MHGSSCEQTINYWQGRLLRGCASRDSAPAVGNGKIYGQDSIGESEDEITIEPRFQRRSATPIGKQADSFAYFAQRQHAQVQQRLIGAFNPVHNRGLRSWPRDLRNDI